MKAMFDESFKKSVKILINEDFLRQPSEIYLQMSIPVSGGENFIQYEYASK